METKIKKLTLILFASIAFWSCSNSSKNAEVSKQEINSDSVSYRQKGFKIHLYSTLKFNEPKLKRVTYNDFLIVIGKDTFPLTPKINKLKVENSVDSVFIEYYTDLNFLSPKYSNDSLLKVIRESKVINSSGSEIVKAKNYSLYNTETFQLRNGPRH